MIHLLNKGGGGPNPSTNYDMAKNLNILKMKGAFKGFQLPKLVSDLRVHLLSLCPLVFIKFLFFQQMIALQKL